MKNQDSQHQCFVDLSSVNCNKIQYNYYSLNEFSKAQHERNPITRLVKVQNNIVNGILYQNDGNFLYPKFRMHKIGETNVYISNYPTSEKDIQSIFDSGITKVVNLLTEEEIFNRQIPDLSGVYSRQGLQYEQSPMEDYGEQLFNDSVQLNDHIAKNGHTVLIHCLSGLSRSPTLLITYLCLFLKIEGWQNPLEVFEIVRQYNPYIKPNLSAIIQVLSSHKKFQAKQILQ